jgi:hypothetical protein
MRQMAQENPTWGAPRIHGELMKLGYVVGERTVSRDLARIRPEPTKPRSQKWATFLKNHARDIVAADMLVVPTIRFQILYVFIILGLERRRLIFANVTTNPTAEWLAAGPVPRLVQPGQSPPGFREGRAGTSATRAARARPGRRTPAGFQAKLHSETARVRLSARGLRLLRDVSPAAALVAAEQGLAAEGESWVEASIPFERLRHAVHEALRMGAEMEVLEACKPSSRRRSIHANATCRGRRPAVRPPTRRGRDRLTRSAR